MFSRIIKKDYFFKLIEENKVSEATILAVPTKELQEAFFNMRRDINSLMKLLKKYDVESKENKYNDTAVSFYFPEAYIEDKRYKATELVAINIKIKGFIVPEENGEMVEIPSLQNKAVKEIEKVLKNLTIEVLDYYQSNVHPSILDKMIGDESHGEGVTFSNMLMLIPEKNQAKLAESLGINRGTITDYKAGRGTPSLKVISKLINLYPLLPWDHYIADIGE